MKVKWPLDQLVTSQDSIVFKWNRVPKEQGYRFILYDGNGEEAFECVVRDKLLIVNTQILRQGNRERYRWSINRALQPCEVVVKNSLELVSTSEEAEMAKKIIKDVPRNENEALYNLSIADALGQAGLLDKALEFYDKFLVLAKK